jgi:hypothetical protein
MISVYKELESRLYHGAVRIAWKPDGRQPDLELVNRLRDEE